MPPPQKPFSEEEKLAIEAQVERLISTPFFSHSRRLPSFLRHVVSHTLAGNSEYLKERTLGIEIFGKEPDYDTALQSAGKPYKLRGEGATTLSDLRAGPSVIIGAFDNAWTLRLLRPLRFHFWNSKDMTRFGIVDASTGQVRWGVDRTQQMTINNYRDYVIVARFTDRVTGQPTPVAAGIGRGGTTTAGEFLTNSDLLQQARAQISSSAAKNVEVVLSTQIIDGEPGKPTIEAVYSW